MVSARREALVPSRETAREPQRVPWSAIWSALASVPDPEIPVLSVVELGVVRRVEWDPLDPRVLVVRVTPTYTGCPATELIMQALEAALRTVGIHELRVERVLSPAWSTSWMTRSAKRKLRDYGIAPPGARSATTAIPMAPLHSRRQGAAVACPRCGSLSTEVVAAFGSTPCKAQYRCRECLEPFDYFKPF